MFSLRLFLYLSSTLLRFLSHIFYVFLLVIFHGVFYPKELATLQFLYWGSFVFIFDPTPLPRLTLPYSQRLSTEESPFNDQRPFRRGKLVLKFALLERYHNSLT